MEEPEQSVDHLVEDPGKLNQNIFLMNLRCDGICYNDNFFIF